MGAVRGATDTSVVLADLVGVVGRTAQSGDSSSNDLLLATPSCSPRSELNQTAASHGRDGFGAANNVEFSENAFDVGLHGAVADK